MFKLIANAWNEYDGFKAVLAVVSIIIGYLGIIFVIMCLQAWAVMLVWNWVAVGIFSAPVITLWSSLGIVLLVHLIIKGWTVKVTFD